MAKKFYRLEKITFSPQLPKAFTEKGLYTLATILKSDIATQTTLAIIETYPLIKNRSGNIKELSAKHEVLLEHMINDTRNDTTDRYINDPRKEWVPAKKNPDLLHAPKVILFCINED